LFRTLFGDHNPDLSCVLNDYAQIMQQNDRHLRSWRLQIRSKIMEEMYSLEHLATTCMQTGDLAQAEIYFRRLLSNLRKRVAPDNELVNRVLSKYAELLDRLGRANDAIAVRTRVEDQNSSDLNWGSLSVWWF